MKGGKIMKEISLYIHIPFCKQRCFYCDFPSFAGKERFREDYIDALVKEIEDKCSKYINKKYIYWWRNTFISRSK